LTAVLQQWNKCASQFGSPKNGLPFWFYWFL